MQQVELWVDGQIEHIGAAEFRARLAAGRIPPGALVRPEGVAEFSTPEDAAAGIADEPAPPVIQPAPPRTMANCPVCHRDVSPQAMACPGCGHPIASVASASSSNVIAAIASFLLPGLGQIAQGRPGVGLIFMVGAVALWAVFAGWLMHLVAAIEAATHRPSLGPRKGF